MQHAGAKRWRKIFCYPAYKSRNKCQKICWATALFHKHCTMYQAEAIDNRFIYKRLPDRG